MKAARNPRAATFRNAEGEVVGTTWGGTWCWHPLNPSKYATVSEDGEDAHIIRCRQCPGCLELDRRALADRLVATLSEEVSPIWVVLVEANVMLASRVAGAVCRTMKSARKWGWCRIGTSRIAIIVAGAKPNLRAARLLRGVSASSRRVSRTRRRRAWREVTAGILYSRSVYGENVNRWYIRGLKTVEKAKRVGVWRGKVRQSHPEMRHGVAGGRAGVALHPPECYLPPRLLKRAAPAAGRWARVGGNVEPIGAVLAGLPFLASSTTFANTSSSPAGGAGAPSLPGFGIAKRSTLEDAENSKAIRSGYSSSRQSDRAEIDAWTARMVEKARARGAPDG